MNLIEAWKEARKGQSIKRSLSETSFKITTHDSFYTFIGEIVCSAYNDNGAGQIEFNLLADDWEIVKITKKVVVEDVYNCDGNLLDQQAMNISCGLPKDKSIKITAEWGE